MKHIVGLLLFIGLIVLFAWFTNELSSSMLGGLDEFQSVVGDTVVLQDDTLMIIDCSFLNDSYTLEDGRTINSELVNKLDRAGTN